MCLSKALGGKIKKVSPQMKSSDGDKMWHDVEAGHASIQQG